ncbi:MAG TPA: class I SAM-dependent methyltransferase [Pseudoxanthomonas sp.]
MVRFWHRFIHPVISTVKPDRIMEIGADSGWTTQHILAYCRVHGCKADIVDPAPRPSLHDVLAQFGDEYRYHPFKSIHAIPQIDAPDVALLDGDHNWSTVYRELTLIFARAAETGVRPPVIMFHDCAWPYARRDMYYSPEDLPATERHPYAYRGLLPGEPELTEDGMNGMLANALHEGGPRNGVLTGIEDFIASVPTNISLYKLPFFNGLGIFVPEERVTPELKALIEGFFSAESLLETCKELETYFMKMNASLQQTEAKLTLRTDALVRARALLQEQAQRIAELEAAARTGAT